jgi:hypothetical protein
MRAFVNAHCFELTHLFFFQTKPQTQYEVDPDLARALEIIFILHLDHEQNASTSTVRTAGSSQANPFACVASGIAALWGKLFHNWKYHCEVYLSPVAIPFLLLETIRRQDPHRQRITAVVTIATLRLWC